MDNCLRSPDMATALLLRNELRRRLKIFMRYDDIKRSINLAYLVMFPGALFLSVCRGA